MVIVPVIDLIAGRVVRGVAGIRQSYRPFSSSRLTDDPSSPRAVAHSFSQLGLDHLYVADLDAINGCQPDWETYQQLHDVRRQSLQTTPVPLWVDAGLADRNQLRRWQQCACIDVNWVIGLETLASVDELQAMLAQYGPDRLLVSLDLADSLPVTRWTGWTGHSADKIARELYDVGVKRLIVLDLRRVGTGQGVGTEPLVKRLRHLDHTVRLYVGGGVRRLDDIKRLEQFGVDGVLVASCLHEGTLNRQQLQHFR